MNDKQENILSKWYALLKVLDDNATLYSSVAALITAKTDLKTIATSVQSYRQGQETDNRGIAQSKAGTKTSLINATLKVSSGIVAYASSIGDKTLKQKTNYTESDLKKTRDTILWDKCKLIYDTATPIATQLTGFFVTAADLTALNTALTNFMTSIPQPRTATAVKKNSTTNLAKLFADGEKIIKDRIDGMMLPFRQTKPDFYNAYITAKKTVNLGTHKVSILGRVISKNSGIAISKAIVKNEEDGQEVATTQRGGYRFRSLLAGTYKLTVSKKGFVTTSFNVTVKEGETTHIDLEIAPE